jgi:hypothetical protein
MEGQIVAECPACGGDHSEGAGCDAQEKNWEVVAEVRSLIQAKILALYLEEAGIETQILDLTFNQEPLPSVRAFSVVKVLAPREKAAEAREALERPGEPPDFADDLDNEPEG